MSDKIKPWVPHTAGEALAVPGWGYSVTAVRAKEPADIAVRVLREYKGHLGAASLAKVGWCYTAKDLKQKGALCVAKIGLNSPDARSHTAVFGQVGAREQPDCIVDVNLEMWMDLNDTQQVATVHHELCHIALTEKGKLRLRGHTVEEFTEVIEAHGLYDVGAREVARAIQMHLPGMASDSVTISSRGKSVTTTEDELGKLVDSITELREEEAA